MELISTLTKLFNKKTPLTKEETKYISDFEENQKKFDKLKQEFINVRNKDKLSERLKIYLFSLHQFCR